MIDKTVDGKRVPFNKDCIPLWCASFKALLLYTVAF